MNRPEAYEKTVNLLLDAYSNNELAHGTCWHCAVGNICKEAGEKTGIDNGEWINLFHSGRIGNMERNPDAVKLISHTEYTIEELVNIELVFEDSIWKQNRKISGLYYIYSKPKEGQYIGLCAVLDVLKEIHEVDESVSNENVERLTEIKEKLIAV